mgnify:CR=1
MPAERDNHPHHHSDRNNGRPSPSSNGRKSAVSRLLLPLRLILALPVWLYQRVISPALPSHCIYTPSCSEYTRQAILKFGLRGIMVGALRVGRCVGSLYEGGEDPVPEKLTAGYLLGSYRKRWQSRRKHSE